MTAVGRSGAVAVLLVGVGLAVHGSLIRHPWFAEASDAARVVGAIEMLVGSALFVAVAVVAYAVTRSRRWLLFTIGAGLLAAYFLLNEFAGIFPP